MNNDMRNIGIMGGRSRNLSTTLLTAMIMGEVPPHLINVAERTVDDLENGVDLKTTNINEYLGVKTTAALSTEDLERLAKAKEKREAKLAKREAQRISSKK